MPMTIQAIAKEISDTLPGGITATIDDDAANIIIGNDKLGFVVTRQQIDDDMHIQYVTEMLPRLMTVLANG